MKKAIKLLLVIISTFIFSCSSSDDCTKTIIIPAQTIITPTGSSFTPESKATVPCDYVVTPIQEQVPLQNFTYEVLNFTFTQNTGNNTNRLKFDIKLNNPNNFIINGFAYFTVNVDGTISSSSYLNGAISLCKSINPNSSCVFSYDQESSLNLGVVQSIQLVDVKYYLTK